ncbi:UNC93-like protein 3 [Camellia lanceoleosa]|uniref:UNC93-like protein 3 n=1 Tax=Camellia lanceoleosa TaxID=1840588 RepID=A0ACC0H7Y4_9ERIC|nr:UNC93-like protein 3 [Camellia lanceoleosa]
MSSKSNPTNENLSPLTNRIPDEIHVIARSLIMKLSDLSRASEIMEGVLSNKNLEVIDFTSLYLGFSASIKWSIGTYLTSLTCSHAHDLNLEEGSVIGNFNREFWGMFACHRFVGNLMFLFLLKDGMGETTSGSGTTLLYIVFVCSMTLGTILIRFLQKRDAKGEETLLDSSVSFYSSIVRLTNAINHPPYCIFRLTTSICMIIYIAEPALGESGVGGAMAVYWAFDVICSLAMGRLTSGLKSITLIVCARAFIQLIVLLWLLLKYIVTSGVLGILYPLLMAATLGIGDGIFNTQLNALLGMLFKHDMKGAFAQLKVWQCVSIVVVFFVSPYISLHAVLVVMLVAVCISVGGLLFLTLMVEKAFSCVD